MAKKATTKAADQAEAAILQGIEKGTVTLYTLDPQDIEARPDDNGRLEPHTEADIKAMAASLKSVGQIHPLIIRPNPEGGKPLLVAGFCRHAAALHIREKQPGYKVTCAYEQDGDNRDSFLVNLAENFRRVSTTPFDDATNLAKLISPLSEGGYGMSQVEAAKQYGKSAAWVNRMLKLTQLPEYLQIFAKTKGMSAAAAGLLVDAPENVIEQVTSKSITAEPAIKALLQEEQAKAAEKGEEGGADASNAEKPAKSKRGRKAGEKLLTPKQVKAYHYKLVEENEVDTFLHQFGLIHAKLFTGKLSMDGFNQRLISLVEQFSDDDAKMKSDAPKAPKAAKKASKKAGKKKAAKKASKKTVAKQDGPSDAELAEIENGGDDGMEENGEE